MWGLLDQVENLQRLKISTTGQTLNLPVIPSLRYLTIVTKKPSISIVNRPSQLWDLSRILRHNRLYYLKIAGFFVDGEFDWNTLTSLRSLTLSCECSDENRCAKFTTRFTTGFPVNLRSLTVSYFIFDKMRSSVDCLTNLRKLTLRGTHGMPQCRTMIVVPSNIVHIVVEDSMVFNHEFQSGTATRMTIKCGMGIVARRELSHMKALTHLVVHMTDDCTEDIVCFLMSLVLPSNIRCVSMLVPGTIAKHESCIRKHLHNTYKNIEIVVSSGAENLSKCYLCE
jgi:hypothetical protein